MLIRIGRLLSSPPPTPPEDDGGEDPPPEFAPSLVFSDRRNSQYVGQVI